MSLKLVMELFFLIIGMLYERGWSGIKSSLYKSILFVFLIRLVD